MEGSIEELARYRYEVSSEALKDAEILFENGRYKNALNRAYYAIFHAIRSVNASYLLFVVISVILMLRRR